MEFSKSLKHKVHLLAVMLVSLFVLRAHAVTFEFSSDISAKDRATANDALKEVLTKVPASFEKGLPSKITIKIKTFANSEKMPDICESNNPADAKFVYGEYEKLSNSLIISTGVLSEIEKGSKNSKKISCQHKNLYEQAIATIIHELTHAYDYQNKKPSQQAEFKDIAGFKRSLFFDKNQNKTPLRSMDDYELKSPEEAFAVNMEYFSLDPEFACRRPVMFNYLKNLFGEDPHKNRSCEVNYTVMVSSTVGLIPADLDPSRVYRIDYLLASKGDSLVSGFGHSMFRIIVCAPPYIDSLTGRSVPATPFGKECLKDEAFHIVPSFRANSEGAALDYVKGVFGGYPSMLFMLNIQDVIKEYNGDEMRDLISYPLKLSAKEKKDFISRLLQEHWDYRGSYKFITNNCAVESLKTLNSIIRNKPKIKPDSILPTLTPNGMLDVLVQHDLVDLEDPNIETRRPNFESLLTSYQRAYQAQNTNRISEKAFVKFIKNSTPDFRLSIFKEREKKRFPRSPRKRDLTLMVESIEELASFTEIEQQVAKTKVRELTKKLADYLTKQENLKKETEANKFIKMIQEKSSDLTKVVATGYGIPLKDEVLFSKTPEDIMRESELMLVQSQKILKELFADETHELEEIASNISYINKSNSLRRPIFRKAFEKYVISEIKSMTKTEEGKMFLQQVANGDTNSFREKLGNNLLTEDEITSRFIIHLINEITKEENL
jgi:hypothetical protein